MKTSEHIFFFALAGLIGFGVGIFSATLFPSGNVSTAKDQGIIAVSLAKEIAKDSLDQQPTSSNAQGQWFPTWRSRYGDSENLRTSFEQSKKDKKPYVFPQAKYILWRLGYFGVPEPDIFDHETGKALRKYQERRGLKVTGDLDFETYKSLHDDMQLLLPIPVGITGPYFKGDDCKMGLLGGRVEAEGTWITEGERITEGIPLQTTRIACLKYAWICLEVTAWISNAAMNSCLATLEMSSREYSIERWDENEIVSKPIEHLCTRSVLRLNLKKETVSKLYTILGTSHDICAGTPNRDYFEHLGNGSKKWEEVLNARGKALEKVISGDTLQMMKEAGDF